MTELQQRLSAADNAMLEALEYADILPTKCPKCSKTNTPCGSGWNRNYRIHYLNYECTCGTEYNITAEEREHRVNCRMT